MANTQVNRLRAVFAAPQLSFAMEAHSAIAAKIATAYEFDVLWASGFSIASAMALHDRNEVSFTQLTDVVALMTEISGTPVLVDADSGFGDFNNFRLLMRRLARIGVGGACIEDKPFPKLNSFVEGHQALMPAEDLCGKIKAAQDALGEECPCIVARTEALIVGAGMKEALRRAEAYRVAGADAILIHSKSSDAGEIIEFATEWNNRLPLVIVPTTYATTPTHVFEELEVSLLIWANHSFRASINAMMKVCSEISRTKSISTIDNQLCSMNQIFGLLEYPELVRDEERYGNYAS